VIQYFDNTFEIIIFISIIIFTNRNGVHPAIWEIYFMVFQLRRKILSARSRETSPDEEVNDPVLLHGQSHSRERDEDSSRGDDQVEDAGIKILYYIIGSHRNTFFCSVSILSSFL
jgi:hypothetical protein